MDIKKIGLCCIYGIMVFGASKGMKQKLPNDVFNCGNWPEHLQLQNTTCAPNRQNTQNEVVLPNDVFDFGTWPADFPLLDVPQKAARQDVETMTETSEQPIYQPQEPPQQLVHYQPQEPLQQPVYYQPQELLKQPIYYQPYGQPQQRTLPTIVLSISFQ